MLWADAIPVEERRPNKSARHEKSVTNPTLSCLENMGIPHFLIIGILIFLNILANIERTYDKTVYKFYSA